MEAETEVTTTTRVTGIKATYTIHENDETTTTTSQLFDASNSNASEVRVGLPIGVEPVKVRLVVCCLLILALLIHFSLCF